MKSPYAYKQLSWNRQDRRIMLKNSNLTGLLKRFEEVYTHWVNNYTVQLVIPAFHTVHGGVYFCQNVKETRTKYVYLKPSTVMCDHNIKPHVYLKLSCVMCDHIIKPNMFF